MSDCEFNMHYVCSHEEAKRLIEAQEGFRLTNCGCREGVDGCEKTRTDVCLMFPRAKDTNGDTDPWIISREEALAILREAGEKRLVTRPWRDETPERTDGICFCCDCCCGYFREPDRWVCDKGAMLERTDLESCTGCGTCVEACLFGTRTLGRDNGNLSVEREKCFGCGLCVPACPEGCIEMVDR